MADNSIPNGLTPKLPPNPTPPKEPTALKKKELEILNSLKNTLESSFINISKATEKSASTMMGNLVGPMKLITDPLQQLTGVDFVEPLKSLPGKIGGLFSKKNKEGKDETKEHLSKRVIPNKQALIKTGVIGSASVYLGNLFEKLFGKASKTGAGGMDSEGFLDGVIDGITKGGVSGLVKGMAPALMKGAGIGLIAGGIIWGVVDGIIAAGKAEEWGVSKAAAGLGGFFGGTGEGGDIKDAFKNAGKFAIAGAGIGLLAGGPIGALAGGLGGAVLGGVLGWIGGENIAGFFQGVGEWFKGVFVNVKEWIGENKDAINAVKESVVGILTTLFSPLIDGVKSAFSGIVFRFRNIDEILGNDEMSFWDKAKAIGKEVILGIIEVPYNFVKGGLASFFGDRWSTMSDIAGDKETTIWEKIGGIGKEILSGIVDKMVEFVGGALGLADNVIKLILNEEWEAKYETLKTNLKEVFGFIITPIVDGVKEFFSGWKERFGNIKEIFGDDDTTLWEKIKLVGAELLGGIWDGFKSLFGGVIGSVKNYFVTILTGVDTLIPKLLGEGGEEKWESFKSSVKEWFGFIFDPFVGGIKDFFLGWKDKFSNISEIIGDEDTSPWEKVKGVLGQLITGIWDGFKSLFGGAIESVKNYFTTILTGIDTLIPKLLGEGGEEKWESFKTSVKEWFGLIFDPFVSGIKNFFAGWKDKFSNISELMSDEDASPWEKIKGIAKELLMGVIEGPINLVKGWIDGLKNNEKFVEMKNKMTDWFTNIGNAVSDWIWGILPDWTQDALRKLGIGPEGAKTEAGVEITNKVKNQLESGEISQEQVEGAANKDFIEGILNNILLTNRKKLSYLVDFEPSKKILSQVGITGQEDVDKLNSWLGEPAGKVNEFKNLLDSIPVEQVKDAVLYKDGTLIEPSPDDHIVFSKNTPNVLEDRTTRQLTNDIDREYFKENIMEESNKKFDSMISLLQAMVDTLRTQKNGGTVIQNVSNGQYSLDSLRMGS